jgi:tetratricopeptide (TPR) repeat protein
MGVGAVLERPFLGWGPDLSREAMRDQIDDGFERDYGDERIEDRAHNAALDLAIFGGLPAVIAGAWFLIEVVRSGWSRRDDVSSRAVLLGLLAFGAHLAFNFPVPELDTVVWLLAGTLVASRPFDGVAVPSLVAGTVVAIVLAFVAFGSLDALSADRQLRLAIDRENSGDVAGAGDGYAAAQRSTPGSSRVHEVRARWLLRTGQPVEAIEAARRAVAADPSDPYQAELLARALNAAALSADGDPRFAVEAEELASALVDSSPFDGSTRLELGTAYAALGRIDEAEAEYRRAADLVPRRSEPVRNLGLLAEQRGDRDGAIELLEAALGINPGDEAAAAALDRLRSEP